MKANIYTQTSNTETKRAQTQTIDTVNETDKKPDSNLKEMVKDIEMKTDSNLKEIVKDIEKKTRLKEDHESIETQGSLTNEYFDFRTYKENTIKKKIKKLLNSNEKSKLKHILLDYSDTKYYLNFNPSRCLKNLRGII